MKKIMLPLVLTMYLNANCIQEARTYIEVETEQNRLILYMDNNLSSQTYDSLAILLNSRSRARQAKILTIDCLMESLEK